MRPDEEASEAYINRDKKFRQNVKTGIGTAASIAGTAGLGGLASKVMPFLNQYVPMGLAMQGINKVAPKLGEFLKRGQSMGLDIKEGMEFIKGKLEPKDERNVIQKYSPELHQFIDQKIKGGKNYLQAGAEAIKDPKFSKVIKKIEQENKTGWWKIMDSIYGGNEEEEAEEPVAASAKQAPELKEFVQLKKNGATPNLKVGDTFTTRKGENAKLTQIDNKTFEYETSKGRRSGPISSLEHEMAPQQQQQAAPSNSTSQNQQALMDLFKKGKQIMGGGAP